MSKNCHFVMFYAGWILYLPSFVDSMLLMARNLQLEHCLNFLFAEQVFLKVKEMGGVDLCGYLQYKYIMNLAVISSYVSHKIFQFKYMVSNPIPILKYLLCLQSCWHHYSGQYFFYQHYVNFLIDSSYVAGQCQPSY